MEPETCRQFDRIPFTTAIKPHAVKKDGRAVARLGSGRGVASQQNFSWLRDSRQSGWSCRHLFQGLAALRKASLRLISVGSSAVAVGQRVQARPQARYRAQPGVNRRQLSRNLVVSFAAARVPGLEGRPELLPPFIFQPRKGFEEDLFLAIQALVLAQKVQARQYVLRHAVRFQFFHFYCFGSAQR